jgi:ribosome-binding factor A
MREFDRSERIGAELRRELVAILRDEVRDPRLHRVTLQEVRVSRDLSWAKVYFTCFPLDEGSHEQARLLNGKLAGFLRAQLARRVRLRTIPQLHFEHDESIARGEHLTQLIDDALGGGHGADATADLASGEGQAQNQFQAQIMAPPVGYPEGGDTEPAWGVQGTGMRCPVPDAGSSGG